MKMFERLKEIHSRPRPFSVYTAKELWTDEYTSKQMLACHLNPKVDLSSWRSSFIVRSVKWIRSHFKVGPQTRIADFGCGPGLYAHALAKSGARVTGIDFSRRSIAYARRMAAQEKLDIDYVAADYLGFDTKDRFDLIMMIFCDFCVLSPKQRRALLRKFRRLLRPGGAVLMDVQSLAAFEKREKGAKCEENLLNGFWAPGKYFGFQNAFKYEKEKVALDKYTIVERKRTRTFYNWFQYYSPITLGKEFADCGLKLFERFGDVAGAPFDKRGDTFAVVARKVRC
ncbi:class I SAM-dependent methyltransferase [Elusimicrobiota bacterium]